jgi:multidrug efflux pump
MNGSFNLSEWAITKRSFVSYLMIVFMVAGIWSYVRLGRSEDPSFTFKTMVVQAQWPGATLEETIQQVTERIERKLQETPNLDYIRSYTTAGESTIFVNVKGSTPAKAVPEAWYQVRKKIDDIRGTLPKGVVGPAANDEFGDTYGLIYGFVADGFTHRELRDYVEEVRSRLLLVDDVAKIDLFGAQDERLYLEFSIRQLSALGVDRASLINDLQAQNVVTPAGVLRTVDEKILVGRGPAQGEFRGERPAAPAAGHGKRQARLQRPAAAAVPGWRRARHRSRDFHARWRKHYFARTQHRACDGEHRRRFADRHRAASCR